MAGLKKRIPSPLLRLYTLVWDKKGFDRQPKKSYCRVDFDQKFTTSGWAPTMIDLDITLVVQLINFVLILIILNFMLIKPIRKIIAQRSETIGKMVTEAEQFSASAQDKLKNYEEALAEARKAGTDQRIAVKDAATDEEKSIIDAAYKEAQKTLGAAREDIKKQVDAAMTDLKGKIDSYAKEATAKILG